MIIKQLCLSVGLILAMTLAVPGIIIAQNTGSIITLPAPQKTGGMPLMETLVNRKTGRAFASRKLPMQELSNLLWATWGINRSGSGHRTAPSAMNLQELTVYAVMEDGAYRYNAEANTLEQVADEDVRAATGMQDFAATAPLNLVFVADMSKMNGGMNENNIATTSLNTGYLSQNTYLYCASAGLSSVARLMFDRDALSKALKLGPDQYITLAQTVGYPQ